MNKKKFCKGQSWDIWCDEVQHILWNFAMIHIVKRTVSVLSQSYFFFPVTGWQATVATVNPLGVQTIDAGGDFFNCNNPVKLSAKRRFLSTIYQVIHPFNNLPDSSTFGQSNHRKALYVCLGKEKKWKNGGTHCCGEGEQLAIKGVFWEEAQSLLAKGIARPIWLGGLKTYATLIRRVDVREAPD